MTFISDWWELDLVDDWAAQKDEDCVTISRPNGVGALQVSAYRKDNGKITDEELLEATDSDATSREKLSRVKISALEGYERSDLSGSSFSHQWWLGSDETMIYMTYNCEMSDQTVESDAVNTMVASIRVRNVSATGLSMTLPVSQ